MAQQQTSLKRARGRVKASLTRLETYVAGLDPTTVTVQDLRVRLRGLEDDYTEFYRIQDKLNDIIGDDDAAAMEAEDSDFQTRFYTLSAKLKTLIDDKNVATVAHTHHDPAGAKQSNIKLPRLDLPSFSGKYEEWTSFIDLFTAAIHDNSSLSGAQKLQYLNASLKGDAQSLIKSIPVTDANYDEAWTILRSRYDNKHLIIQSMIKSIVSHPQIRSESAHEIRKLLDVVVEKIRSLKVLGCQVEHWDPFLVFHLTDKLDGESRKQWELTLKPGQLPTYKEATEFLEARCRALDASSCGARKQHPQAKPQTSGKSSLHSSNLPPCPACGSKDHRVYKCDRFLNADHDKKREICLQNKLCHNCLGTGHLASNCTSKYTCKTCNKHHHSSMHRQSLVAEVNNTTTEENQEALSSHVSTETSRLQKVLLSTVQVKVRGGDGAFYNCRALLDSGAEATFISEQCVKRLKLTRQHAKVSVTGLAQTAAGTTRGVVDLQINSNITLFTTFTPALILNTVTDALPSFHINPEELKKWKHLQTIKLADPEFYVPSEMDIILSGDIDSEVKLDGKLYGPTGTPKAQNTEFGWVVSGKVNHPTNTVHSHLSMVDIDASLKKFWEIEEIALPSAQSLEEKACEAHFLSTYRKDPSGKFIVRLPFKSNAQQLGTSREIAVKRLIQIENKLSRNPELKAEYHQFMDQYLALGHMEPIQDVSENASRQYYMPHHIVVKPTSSTTKYRVVFDASCRSSNGVSLNEILAVGPTIQQDLVSIFTRFRTHKIALSADVAKMYRQIIVDPEDQDYQRIVWRNKPSDPIQDFRLKTVTYGTASAPYLATKCLQRVALDHSQKNPHASFIIMRDFYIDDLISGTNEVEDALSLQRDLIDVLHTVGFPLRKWSSNDPSVLDAVSPEDRETKSLLDTTGYEWIRALGVQWNPAADQFMFSVTFPPEPKIITKRNFLSDVARIYDPMGWLAPVVISAKILFQKLWLLGLTWDEELPADVTSSWLTLRRSLPDIQSLNIQRWIHSHPSTQSHVLIGFSDGSEVAYSACVYLRVLDKNGVVHINLIAGKTRVAPIKQISVPRLELSGAYLLSVLMEKIKSAMDIRIDREYAFTDSTITLAWIQGSPSRWKTFVANRVSQIQDRVAPEKWYHVSTKDNPADCASRGITVADLKNHPLWWTGPSWLMEDPACWPLERNNYSTTLEERTTSVHQASTPEPNAFLDHVSTLTKLQRLTCLWKKYTNIIRKLPFSRGPFTVSDLQQALEIHIKLAQREVFHEEVRALIEGKELSTHSKLLRLRPFMDSKGILRVGGRLKNSNLDPNQRNPILLPKSHKLTRLIIEDAHRKHLHAGPGLLMSILHQIYWIISSRDQIRRIVHNCLVCQRDKAKVKAQLMGDLPSYRVNPKRAFQLVGVDYAGPFLIKQRKGKGNIPKMKSYVSVFVCMTTKAIHLELVTELTTEAFLAAFRRFVSRRGKPSDVFSDNGTNFIGANKELQLLLKQLFTQDHNRGIINATAEDGITWHFIPPSSPHFGGLWEAGVKSMKTHLRRVGGCANLTYEEFNTVLCQIEACLNSRPLFPMSSDPSDLEALTPGHFLIGTPLVSVPEADLQDIPENRLGRWQLLQRITQDFWKRWQNEYLTTLQQRPKWNSQRRNIEVGDLALLKDDQTIPGNWTLCRVIEVHPGTDGVVRVATIKTSSGIFKRPIMKLCLLFPENCSN